MEFENFKNYEFYFPYNNISYNHQLLSLPNKEKKFNMQRIYFDNFLEMKRKSNL